MKDNINHLRSFGAVYFFIFAAVASLYPFLPLLLQSKGFNPSQVGFLLGSYDLFSIAGLLIMGFFYDRLRSPRITILIIGLISTTILFLLARSESTILIIVFALFLGFFVKSPTSLLDALYGQTMINFRESYGKIRLGGSLGFFTMALFIRITQWVQGSRPLSVSAGYAICMSITLIILVFLPGQTSGRPIEKKEHLGLIKAVQSFPSIFWIGLVIAFLSSLSMSGHYTFFSLFLRNKFHLENVSGFWAIGPLFEIPLFFFSPLLIKRFKLRTLWLVCLIAGIIRMQVYSRADSLLPLYIVQISHSFSFGLNHLCMVSLINKNTKVVYRGFAMSIYTAIGMVLSMFTGGILGGIILQGGDFQLLFQVFSLFPITAIVVAIIFLKEKELTQ